MVSPKTRVAAVTVAAAVVVGLPLYGYISMRNHFENRVGALEREIIDLRAQYAKNVREVASGLSDVADKTEATTRQLEDARRIAESLKQEQSASAQSLRAQLESASLALSQLGQDASARLEQVQQDAANRIAAGTADVQTVRTDMDATRDAARMDLAANRKETADIRDSSGGEIARNSSELAELRRRGERDYFEFDIQKSKDVERIADIRLQLKRADTRKQKFDVVLFVDDNKFEKKDRAANEPVTFLVGPDRLPYELVVNYVDKDRIRGYVSTPKDRVLSPEGPMLKPQK